PNDGICETATPGVCTLRAAVQQANVTGGVVDVPAFTITLGDSIHVGRDMTIHGAGMRATVVSGAGLYGVFSVRGDVLAAPPTVSFADMTIRDGHGTLSGGGIYFEGDSLTIDRCLFTNDYAPDGGAIL